MRSWEGHYRSLTHMAFTDDGSHLVTCSEDSLVRVWGCGQLLDYYDNGILHLCMYMERETANVCASVWARACVSR